VLQLDGIALAIELAASHVGSYGIRGTADLLDGSLKLTWQGRPSTVPRHQTLPAMLDWSYHLLSERDCSVLCRLSVFVGLLALEGVQAVAARHRYGHFQGRQFRCPRAPRRSCKGCGSTEPAEQVLMQSLTTAPEQSALGW
jgi:predicted ATPase